MPEVERMTARIEVALKPSEKERLARYIKDHSTNLSQVIRKCVLDHLAKEGY